MIRRRKERQIRRMVEHLQLGLMGLDLESAAPVIRAEVSHGQRLASCTLWIHASGALHRVCDLPAGAHMTTEMVQQAAAASGLFANFDVDRAQWKPLPNDNAVELALSKPGGWPGPELTSTSAPHATAGAARSNA